MLKQTKYSMETKTPPKKISGRPTSLDVGLGKRRWVEERKEEAVKETPTWPSFLVVKCVEEGKTFNKVSPFYIDKSLKAVAGEPRSVTKLHRTGELLVEAATKSHSEGLQKCKRLCELQVEVTPHKSLNTSRGVISSRDLLECSEKEIVEGIDGVIHARRIIRRRDGDEVKTPTIILTFGTRTPPENVKAGYLRIPVRPYIPNPMRCFKCQEFGHGAAVCKKNVKCARCSVEGHEDKGCTAPFKCSHCSAGHSAYSKDCPVWKQEIAIQEYKARNGCTFGQAKAHFMALPKSQYSLTKSYAQVVAKVARTIATQTDLFTPPLPSHSHSTQKKKTSSRPSSKVQTGVASSQEITTSNRFSVLSVESMEIEAPEQPVSPGIPGEKSSGSDSPRESQPDTPSPSGEGVDKLLPNGRSPAPAPDGGTRRLDGGNTPPPGRGVQPPSDPGKGTPPERGVSASPLETGPQKSKSSSGGPKLTGIKGPPTGGHPKSTRNK